jgi:hypothetical protein
MAAHQIWPLAVFSYTKNRDRLAHEELMAKLLKLLLAASEVKQLL